MADALSSGDDVVAERHLWAVLDLLPHPLFILTPRAEVAGANRAARRMLEFDSVVRLVDAQLHANDAEADGQLRDAIRRSSGDAAREIVFIRLPGASDERPLECSVLPLPDHLTAVIVSPPQPLSCHSELLQRIYGLTRTEARVVLALLDEGSPAGASRRLGITINTVRRHMKSIFIKTRVSRQSELVRLLFSGVCTFTTREPSPDSLTSWIGVANPPDRRP